MTDSNESHADPATAADDPTDGSHELPDDVVDEAERLTRLERTVPDDSEAQAHTQRRDELLEDYEFTSRIRDDDGDDVLVLHPEKWHDDHEGVIRTDRIEDISRAVEIPLEGTADPDDWDVVDTHNRELVAQVRTAHGDVHGDNAAALADFVGNHYAKQVEDLTNAELEEFRTEYFVRNSWPSDEQQAVLDESITLVYETAGEPEPDAQVR
ncbi:DUF7108 family protein [Natronorubrum sulfidifaciens]|uniref:RnhA operon protein n=1 Tax=Natronorubrum sulfidifaciens JCM 14089 TaxID=1230460 RepID=L9WF84_9EURY|nr:hypothetical protein [Natronorubrum sulfidifaciens]ELY48165.1 hypothetical protein C495_01785 [Natronorubrum sulfidifaciens JCM 14089]